MARAARSSRQLGAVETCRFVIERIEDLLKTGLQVVEITRDVATSIIVDAQEHLRMTAEKAGATPRDLACTVVAGAVAPDAAAFFQLGDGVVIVGPRTEPTDEFSWIFWPERGEYANMTAFLSDERVADHLQHAAVPYGIDEVAVLTDGIQNLVLDYKEHAAHGPFFTRMMAPLRARTNVRSFNGLARSPNHDNFGLAVLIFQTLFLARHPFAGAYQGDGDMPIERAIRELRFAYGRDAQRQQMKQPPGSLGLGAVPAPVAQLFERAFLEGGARGHRPSAIEWATVLDAFLAELRDCPKNSGHAYARTVTRCPLCEIEGHVGVLLFLPPRQAAVQAPTINIEDLWRDLGAIITSARLPAISRVNVPALPPSDAILKFKRATSRASALFWVGVAVCILLAMVSGAAALAGALTFPVLALIVRGRPPDEARNIRERLNAAQERFNAVLRQIEGERTTSVLPGLEARAESLYRGLRGFQQRRAERLMNLDRSGYQRQMRRFLDQFEVKDSRLRGFGPGLFAALVSHGVETADDLTIERLQRIAGFGPKRISALRSGTLPWAAPFSL